MKKHTRRHKADGGDLHSMHRSHGGSTSAMQIACGKAAGVRSGSSPAERLATGHCEGKRGGNGAKSIGMGHPTGRRKFATGGHATDMGFEAKGERLKKSQHRNDVLGSPHYAEGGKVHQGMRALYHALHSHFASEPQMKKLHVKESQLYEGEPHRYKRASGGPLWMQKASNPETKGSLHRSLNVPMGNKIPMSKIHQAENSKSPLLRKRANLAETFKKYRPQ